MTEKTTQPTGLSRDLRSPKEGTASNLRAPANAG